MIIKIVGCVVVIVSSTFLGYTLAGECARRTKQLRVLQGMFQILENEIGYLYSLLIDAFEKVCKSSKDEVGCVFRDTVKKLKEGSLDAGTAWEESVDGNIGKTALNEEDKEILISFGKMLGNSDMEGQLKNIKLTIERLKIQEKKAEESRKKNQAMYRSLGVLGGIAVVIVLI